MDVGTMFSKYFSRCDIVVQMYLPPIYEFASVYTEQCETRISSSHNFLLSEVKKKCSITKIRRMLCFQILQLNVFWYLSRFASYATRSKNTIIHTLFVGNEKRVRACE